MPERVPWKESNLALIGSDLDHKIKAAAAEGEDAWEGIRDNEGKKIWRIEQFKVVPWPEDQYGKFHKGDSYIVLNAYKKGDGSDTLYYDIHIWIGSESSQDEYGTAAYKMVEADEFLGGAAVQHRQCEGHESPTFQDYFDGEIIYLNGGVDTGFTHVEASEDVPHLYRIKGTEKGLSLTQMELSKSSLNAGDSFILFANKATVWVWHGESANPDEKLRSNSMGEKMCIEGTVKTLEQGAGDADDAEFWAYLGEGEIGPADDKDEQIEQFSPLLFKVVPGADPEQVAKGEPIKGGPFKRTGGLDRALLDDTDVFILDAGWEVFLWIGANADRSEKLSAISSADRYCKQDPRTADIPLTIMKSGMESQDFNAYFK